MGFSASISGSGKGNKIAVLLLLLCSFLPGQSLQDHRVKEVYFSINDRPLKKKAAEYRELLDFKPGELYSPKRVRNSMENLYKVGSFTNIEARVEKLPGSHLNIYFDMYSRYIIDSVKIKGPPLAKKGALSDAIYSLHQNSFYRENDIPAAVDEIRKYLESRGFFNSEIEHRVVHNRKKSSVDIRFHIKAGQQAIVKKAIFTAPDHKLLALAEPYFKDKFYLPYKLADKIDKVVKKLKKMDYHFPEIQVNPVFLNDAKTSLNLEIKVDPGFKYIFEFRGIRDRTDLIASLWEKKRFEKWAEKESVARILYHLRNSGYLDAKVESEIRVKGAVKYLTFTVKKGKKYILGKIGFRGNRAFDDKALSRIIETDDQVFDKLFWLRASSLIVDLGVLKQFYHFSGFPLSRIFMDLNFRGGAVDIDFVIEEGRKYTVESVLFEGNDFFDSQKLLGFLKTKPDKAFVQQVLSRDIENLKQMYRSRGFDKVNIDYEVSPGADKAIRIKITEGDSFTQGNLVVIGASGAQRRLIEKLFPLRKDAPFHRDRVEKFIDEIEESTLFNEVRVSYIEKKESSRVDVLVKVTPDRSNYYGFGIGWQERSKEELALLGVRGTLEYQAKNIFGSTSSFSVMLQGGLKEQRGQISYDTPYFLRKKINSSFKIWADTEVYPSYEFKRFGFGESLVRKLTPNSYILASLSWYRTELIQLETSEQGVDRLDVPFDTTALNLSYVLEKRDNPFNPTSGDYFSSDIKVGFPLFEKNYSFIKFLWSYQKNLKFLKNGVLSLSIRNGFASGDMSITERFFAGGVHSFRGTKNDYLSPIDPVTGAPMGGNAMLLINVEATFPLLIVPVRDLYYSIFYDTGNVFEKVNDFDLSRMERAIGFSLKLMTPMGPFRIDLGWNLRERPEGQFEWNIGIGHVF